MFVLEVLTATDVRVEADESNATHSPFAEITGCWLRPADTPEAMPRPGAVRVRSVNCPFAAFQRKILGPIVTVGPVGIIRFVAVEVKTTNWPVESTDAEVLTPSEAVPFRGAVTSVIWPVTRRLMKMLLSAVAEVRPVMPTLPPVRLLATDSNATVVPSSEIAGFRLAPLPG